MVLYTSFYCFAGFIFFVVLKGNRLPRSTRKIIYYYFILWGVYAALLGRTIGVGNSLENIVASVYSYLTFGLFLVYGLVRLSAGDVKRYLYLIIVPLISIFLSMVLASAEEILYLLLFGEGGEAKARFSVSASYLKYDVEKNMLMGWSD